ncbi:hypothetical protein HHI36_008141 [Cryptolaemus montrouzieri]|uniref:Protein CNPPD1 n=1 Tax=Cryptolaemus montrouzieri TaxID=559131 RepID=A0ABD2MRM1_9CUCU
MSAFSMKRPDKHYMQIDHQKYIARITKSLYYGKLPKTDRLSLPVTELAAELFSEAQRGKSLERLHLNTASSISRNACVSPCSLILAMLYLDRLKTRNPDYLERTSPSDLFLVSLMISSKYLFDDGEFDEVFMDEWATSGRISVSNLVQLEQEFLKAIDWEIYVKEITFWKKLNELETELAQREGSQRGFFTYTELTNLSSIIEMHLLIQCLVTMTVILITTYTVGVLTIAGSFHLVSLIPGNAFQTPNVENILNLAKLDKTIKLQEDRVKYADMLPKIGGRNVEPVHILRTSLFLASINTLMGSYCNSTNTENISDNNSELPSWEWWNIPSMIWLTENSEEVHKLGNYISLGYLYRYFIGYLEMLAINSENLEVGNYINMNKATKTRIQDQMESSWHKEWIDSLENGVHYMQYIHIK